MDPPARTIGTSTPAWPGSGHRRPRRSAVTYPVRRHLSAWLEEQAQLAARDLGRYRVLDVGCGSKPYYPYFAPYASEYVGVDIDIDNPAADVLGPVEDLPLEDESFDVVLCTQVLEHCADPDRAVRELWRVTAPGGAVLASTHGVQVYHPSPEDYWRWTHTGLELLFLRNGRWASVAVEPAGGMATCVAAVTGRYADLLLRRARLAPVAKGVVWLLNTAGAAIDRHVPALRETKPGSIFLNYHVLARKPR
ncbi:MAG TPA: class I SAM-dependent methyltransferase [Gaiellaceae bacterium]|nr:class I SAM-dependent methyltransferase [Gaiellaceae bacterium]